MPISSHAGSSSLHQLVEEFGRSENGPMASEYLNRIKKLIEEGADPNEENAHDMTPLAILMDAHMNLRIDKIIEAPAHELVSVLIQNGANPLSKDRSLGKSDGSELGRCMVERLIELHANGCGLQDEGGGNFLHVLAEDDPNLLLWTLRQNLSAMKFNQADPNKQSSSFPFDTSWLLERRPSDGATPLHAMFSDDSILVLYAEAEMDAGEYDDTVWECMHAIKGCGVGFDTQDGNGVSLASKVAKMVRKKVLVVIDDYDPLWDEIKILAAHEKLQKKTKKTHTMRPSARL